ncbi:TonB-dependent receptor [Formosa agariphila KMM 3901]|uniref:TonB-dependent receptor n=1 Tax=Formosa agariphila (strain DSM 15362 / KCTC 12365 / LMG 23005 / KMM 3901 / M-2Alg 35-1) TaxID=1347342 RepID=T2KPH4_FORAG|nr:TonB-dependent receptor [Formosa agariphila]CDF80346.1 TonB-dependent receptor [Formosa agariphila KMM 3901]
MKKQFTFLLLTLAACLCFEARAQSDPRIISGTVVDDNNVPILGLNVVITGTTTGTTTDFDGNYSIQVPEDMQTLSYTYIGYLSQTITINNQTVIDVKMITDVSKLDEVVIVAYGSQKKEAITSSVVSVNSEELEDITTPDVSSMLQGKAAGVQVSATGGSPGASPEILIRGRSSLGGSVTPLWVVDGVIQHGTPIINPNDVDTVSVLKDASATALYGSRGANGVIIVNTKRGEVGKSEITVSYKTGMNQFNMGNFEVMNSQELYDYNLQLGNNNPWFSEDLLSRDTDWIDIGTQTGIVKDANISFTSGTENLNLFLNTGYYGETGTLKGNELNRYTFRMNLDYQMSERFKLKPKISFSFDERDNVAEAPLYDLYLNLPWDLPYDENGEVVNANESQDWIGRDGRNYLYDQQWNYSSSSIFNMSANLDFEYKILKNLTFLSTNNFTLYRSLSKSYTDPRSNAGLANTGSVSDATANRFTRLTTQMLRYKNSFNESHDLSVLAGYEYNDYKYETFGATGTGIIPGGEVLDIASKPGAISGLTNEYALQSYFLAAEYGYADRYFLKGSIRRDGASNFGLDSQYGNFFSISGGWLIHNESFFNSRAINELKLRASYGTVGNRPSSLYPYQGTYAVDTQYVGVPGAILSQFGNPDLSWEKSFETNLALDINLFNRISATFEYYNKDTSDLLYYVSLPDITAYSGYWENIGGVNNSGFEASFNADIIQKDNFNWNIGFNIGVNKNEVTELYEADELPQGRKLWKVGENADSWYMRKWAGVHPGDGNPLWEVVDPETGDISYTSDYASATVQFLDKASTPEFVGGFNSSWSYKGLTLSTSFDFSKGGYIYNSSRELFDSDGIYPTFNQQVLSDGWSRWEEPGDQATHPRPVSGGNNNSNKPSSRYLEDGSFFRMRNVTLSYNLPPLVLSQLKLSNINVYVSGDNLFTITNYSGVDPSVGGITGEASLSYPIPKRLVLGLNVSF